MGVDNNTEEKSIETKNEVTTNSKLFNYESFKNLMLNDLVINSDFFGFWGKRICEYTIEEIDDMLSNPSSNWNRILQLSKTLMFVSPHYEQLCNMLSDMTLFQWGIDLYGVKENTLNIDNLKKSYNNLSTKLENFNFKSEFKKIVKVLPYQDIYFGLVVETDETVFFKEVNYNLCEIKHLTNGLYSYAIDLSRISSNDVAKYPIFVQEAYKMYAKDNKGKVSKWYTPPMDKQICVKLNNQWLYPYPIFMNLFKDIFYTDLYKKIQLQSAKADNYKAILTKIPIDDKVVDKPLVSDKALGVFAQINRENLPDDVGMIYTLGSDGEAITFKNSSSTRNNVKDAIDELYNSSGSTKELFNGSSSGTAVKISVEKTSSIVYGVYRRLEDWVNNYIKLHRYNKSNYKFKFYLLDATVFNIDTISAKYKDACTLGAPVVDKWLSSLGMTPSRILGSYVVHDKIFDFQSNFKPLMSSFNMSNDKKNGRPTNESKGESLSDAGEKTVDNDGNLDR